MIRINLLGTAKAKKGKRSAATVGATEPGVMIAAVVILLVAAIANAGYYLYIKRESERVQKELQAAEVEYQRLAQVKLKYEEREKQLAIYKRRVDVIDKLRKEQSGPVNLLLMMGDTVNATDEVWLHSMKDDGANINLQGMALGVHAVANFMRNLQTTGYFRSVEIKESYQDDTVRDLQAFYFTLVCQKQQAATPPGKS